MLIINIFDLSVKRNIVDESTILNKIEKAKQIKEVSFKKGSVGPPLLNLIQQISESMDMYLGDKKDNYRLINNYDELVDYCDHIIENGAFSIDTETTGLDPLVDNIVGMSLYTPGQKAVYIPIHHVSYITRAPISNQIAPDRVKQQLQRLIDSNCKAIFANSTFDIRVIKKWIGVELSAYFDCIIAAKMLNENESSNRLKDLYKKYILRGKEDAFTFGELFNGVTFDVIPPNVGYLYAARDAEVTWELYEFQLPYLTPTNNICISKGLVDVANVFWNIEMPMVKVVTDMENIGVAFDDELRFELSKKYNTLLKEKEEYCYNAMKEYEPLIHQYELNNPNSKLDHPINLGSPAQLSILLYDILRIKPPDPKQPRGTGEPILAKIDLPLCKAILDYRELSKLVSTYIDKLPNCINKEDGRIHCKFNQLGAKCITYDSLVPTVNGYEYIGDIVGDHFDGDMLPNDTVVLNKDLELETASDVVMYHDRETIKLDLSLGLSIEGTPNHPVMCGGITKSAYTKNHSTKSKNTMISNRTFKQLKDVTLDDYIEVPIGYNLFSSTYQKLTLSEISINTEKTKDLTIPTILDETFAEFLGMYFADGSVSNANGSYRVSISNDNQDVIDRVCELTKSIFNCDAHTMWNHTTYNTYLSGKKLEMLNSYFCRGAYNKVIPKELYKSPKSVICAFIRGLTLDSSYDKNRHRLCITLCNYNNARFIQQCLLNMGIVSSISRYRKNNTNKLSISGHNYLKFINDIGVVESCKCDKSDILTPSTTLKLGNSLWVSVKSIKSSTSNVYDFHLPKTHSFIANGIINHNTGRMSSNNPNL